MMYSFIKRDNDILVGMMVGLLMSACYFYFSVDYQCVVMIFSFSIGYQIACHRSSCINNTLDKSTISSHFPAFDLI